MNRRTLAICAISAIILALIFLFYDARISAGIVLGFLADMLYLRLLAKSIDARLSGVALPNILFLLGYGARMLLLAVPLLLSLLYPSVLNVFGTFFGLLLFKLCLYIESMIRKG